MKRNILLYNSKLKELTKKLRSNTTYSEVKLWNELKNGKLYGYDFDRQRATLISFRIPHALSTVIPEGASEFTFTR